MCRLQQRISVQQQIMYWSLSLHWLEPTHSLPADTVPSDPIASIVLFHAASSLCTSKKPSTSLALSYRHPHIFSQIAPHCNPKSSPFLCFFVRAEHWYLFCLFSLFSHIGFYLKGPSVPGLPPCLLYLSPACNLESQGQRWWWEWWSLGR